MGTGGTPPLPPLTHPHTFIFQQHRLTLIHISSKTRYSFKRLHFATCEKIRTKQQCLR